MRLPRVQSISAASLKSSAPAEPEKLTKLEAELTKLREEIGLLMQAKLQLAVRASPTRLCSAPNVHASSSRSPPMQRSLHRPAPLRLPQVRSRPVSCA